MGTIGRLKEGDLYLTGELNERGPAIQNGLLAHYPLDGDNKTSLTKFKVIAERYNTNDGGDGGLWDESGVKLYSYGRDWHISVWDMQKNNWATGINFYGATAISGAHARYDVYSSTTRTAQQQAFADTLNNLSTNYIVIIGGAHAPDWFDARMVAAIKRCGGTAGSLGWGGSRQSYICVGEVGCGEGNAIAECLDNMAPSPGESPWAEAEVGLYARMALPSTAVILPEGAAMELATTNLLPHDGSIDTSAGQHTGDIALSNGNGTDLGGGWRASTHYNDAVCKVIRTMTPLGEGKAFRWIQGKTTGWKAVTAGGWPADAAKTYTVSVYVRVNGRANPTAYAFYGDASHRFHFQWEKTPRLYQNEWVRGTYTFSPATSHSGSIYLYGDSDAQPGSTIDYCLFQVEEKTYPTTFTNATRASGTATIYAPIGTSDFTIVGEFKPNADSDTLPNGSYFLNLNNGMILRTYNSQPYIDGNAITGVSGQNVHINFNTKQGIKVHYIVKRTGTTFSWRMKAADGQDFTWTKTDARVAGFIINSMTLHCEWGGVHRNLSIYNRSLSDTEIQKLIGGSFSITKQGGSHAEIVESQVKTNEQALYIPLDSSGESQNGGVIPISEMNTAYENGAVWLGNPTTNLSSLTWLSTFQNAGVGTGTNNSSDLPRIYPDAPVMKYTLDTADATSGAADGCIQVGYTVASVSTVVSASCWVWLDVAPTDTRTIWLREYYDGGNSSKGDMNYRGITRLCDMPQKEWPKVEIENVTTRADLNPSLRINTYLSTPGSRVYFTAPQIEKAAYVTPFVAGTRSEGELHYPYDILNMSQDFTIMGWWKPMDVADGTYNPVMSFNRRNSNYTSRRILLMNNGGTSSHLRGWVGNGTTELAVYAPSSPGIQKNKWNFFAFVKTATTVKLWHGVNGSIGYGSNSTAPSYINTLWSGDGTTTYIDSTWAWKIGEYASGGSNLSNAYFQDYSFAPVALSDDEIENLFKTEMRSKERTLQTRRQFKEGKVL